MNHKKFLKYIINHAEIYYGKKITIGEAFDVIETIFESIVEMQDFASSQNENEWLDWVFEAQGLTKRIKK